MRKFGAALILCLATVFESALAQDSASLATAYKERANAYYSEGDYDRAITDYSNALRLDPKIGNVGLAASYVGRANAHYGKTKYDLAMADYNEAIRLDPTLALAYFDRGNLHYAKTEYDLAFADYNQAIRLDPALAAAYVGRGNVHHAKTEYDLAMADYNQAIRLDPTLALGYLGRANVHYGKTEYDLAMLDYNEAIRLDPTLALAYVGRANLYYSKGSYDLAITDYSGAMRLDPKIGSAGLAVAYVGRANAHYGKTVYDLAMADYNEAVSLQPTLAVAYVGRANVHYGKTEYDSAMADYNEAVSLDPTLVVAYVGRGNVYYAKGSYDLAITDYNKAIQIGQTQAVPGSISTIKPGVTITQAEDQSAELNLRSDYWKSKLPLCSYEGGEPFPSKYQRQSYSNGSSVEGPSCNDGDSVIFNGLTCAVGDDRGCTAVARSQAGNGLWLRSPKRLYEQHIDPKGEETVFSNDHALGAMLYILQKKDKEAFNKWIKYISSVGRYLVVVPKYCSDDRCAFKPIDCPLLDRVALALGEANPACDLVPVNLYDTLTSLQQNFDDIIDEINKVPGVDLISKVDPTRKLFDTAMGLLRTAIANVEHLRQMHDTFTRALTDAAGIVTLINAEVNDAGYPRHDVAVEAYILMKYGGINLSDVVAHTRHS